MPTVYKRGKAYRVQFVDARGKRRQKQFKRLRDANTFTARLSTGAVPDLTRVTVSDMARQWLKACAVGRDGHPPLEAQTLELYTGYVDNWILPELGTRRIGTIQPSELRAFRDGLVDEEIARTTAKKIVGVLKGIFGHAVAVGEIAVNPCAGITVRIGARHERRIEVFELGQVRTLLEVADQLALDEDLRVRNAWIRYSVFVSILAHTGIRLSECRGLTRVAWSKEDATLRIFQRADKRCHIGPVKSLAGRRLVFLPPALNDRLELYLRTHTHDLIFPSRTGKPLDATNIGERCWAPLLQKAGLKHRGIHVLRHFYASRLIAMGESVKEVAVALGHADEAFTLRTYGHLFQDRDNVERRKQRAEAVI